MFEYLIRITLVAQHCSMNQNQRIRVKNEDEEAVFDTSYELSLVH